MTISVWWNVGNADTQHKGSNSKAGTSWIHWHESHLVFRPSISSDFIWNALKECFIRACRYLFRPSALFLPSVLKTHTHMHSSQTDMLKTLRCVLRMLQLYSGTLKSRGWYLGIRKYVIPPSFPWSSLWVAKFIAWKDTKSWGEREATAIDTSDWKATGFDDWTLETKRWS